jgi:hypothetical protein
LLDEIAGRLANLEDLFVKPQGCVYPVELEVDRLIVLDFQELNPHSNLFAIVLFNDGPDDVYPGVNEHQNRVPLKAGESVEFDYNSPRIRRLILDIGAGKKATVRGFGIY